MRPTYFLRQHKVDPNVHEKKRSTEMDFTWPMLLPTLMATIYFLVNELDQIKIKCTQKDIY